MSLTIQVIRSTEDFSPSDFVEWNRLAKNPMQRWEWLGSWWEAFQEQYDLHVLAVKRSGRSVAFAPWCIEKRIGTGRTIQFLGSGKACTDHLSLLVGEEDTQPVCNAIAKWLAGKHETAAVGPAEAFSWDSLELIGVDQRDPPINALTQAMEAEGLSVDRRDGMGCYVIDLPSRWEDYVGLRSKSGRREIRQSLKQIDDGLISIFRIQTQEQLDTFWEQFVRLHQRRRADAGTTNCFDYPGFDYFLRTAASRLLASGMLELIVASSDDVPVATQFALVDRDAWYFYQSGMEPDAAELRPGLALFCNAIRQSIGEGKKRFDMMRGDESYKLRWRAELVPAQEVRVWSPRRTAQMRHQVYQAGVTFKNLLKSGFGVAASR